jgi:hypothetical protein
MNPDPLPPPGADLGRAILGTWGLLTREDYDRDGRRLIDPVLGADPLGTTSFAPGHFAAQFMNRRRTASPTPVTAPAPSAGANNSRAVDGYDAYFGTYTVDAAAGTITVTLKGSVAPANVGLTLTRDVRVIGDRLLIRLATTAVDGTPITRTLTFERLG